MPFDCLLSVGERRAGHGEQAGGLGGVLGGRRRCGHAVAQVAAEVYRDGQQDANDPPRGLRQEVRSACNPDLISQNLTAAPVSAASDAL